MSLVQSTVPPISVKLLSLVSTLLILPASSVIETSNYYVIDDLQYTWSNAAAYCLNTYCSSLATISNADELAELSPYGYIFIGGTDIVSEGTWKWQNGDTISLSIIHKKFLFKTK